MGSQDLVAASQFPGAMRRGLSSLPAFQTVIFIEVAGCSQRLVVKADAAGQQVQLFAELVNILQLGRRGRDLKLRGLQKLLVAAIEQPCNLTLDERAGMLPIG